MEKAESIKPKGPIISCEHCGRPYKTVRGYEKHKLTHQQIVPSSTENTATIQNSAADNEIPEAASENFTCSVCPKTYKSLGGLKKHTLKHGTSQDSTAEHELENVPSSADLINELEEVDTDLWPELPQLNEEDGDLVESELSYFEVAEEEEHYRRENCFQPTEKISRKSQKKLNQTATLVTCSECGRKYKTIPGYLKHRMSHAMQVALANLPQLDEVKEQAHQLAEEVLDEIISSTTDIGCGVQCKLYSGQLRSQLSSGIGKEFLKIICEGLLHFTSGNKFLLPSQLRECYVRSAAAFLVDVEKREGLFSLLEQMLCSSVKELNVFLSSFVRRFSDKVLVFIMHYMIHGKNSPIVSLSSMQVETSQSTDSLDFKQIMHYIGGANVKSLLRKLLKIKNRSAEWERVVYALRNYFIVSELSEAPEAELLSWTAAQDYGKLTKISNNALQFFVKLGETVKFLERADGSLITEECIQKVIDTPHLLFLWDSIINGCLPEAESMKLLLALCNHFCVTWRNGIIARRLNNLSSLSDREKPGTSGVSFRAHLA